MTQTSDELGKPVRRKKQGKRRCIIIAGAIFLFLLLLSIIILVLALTVFRTRQPIIKLQSATVAGVSPRVSLPVLKIELNLTLDLELLVENRNHASFKHGEGKSDLIYREKQVGEAIVFPGMIPARGSATLFCRLSVEVDELASEMAALIQDVLAGEIMLETRTRIPGRINFLGIFRKHAVAISECQITVGFPDLKLRQQVCKQETKL